MDFEAGHIVDTKFKILNKDSKDLQNEIKVVFGCDTSEQTGSITIENLKVEVKSNDFSLKHPSVGGAEGKMTLQAAHISLKVNLKYDLITETSGP